MKNVEQRVNERVEEFIDSLQRMVGEIAAGAIEERLKGRDKGKKRRQATSVGSV